MTSPSVLLVDPRRLVADALAESLREDHTLEVAATADDVQTALLQATRTAPDVVVISAELAGPLPALCERLNALDPSPRMLLVDSQADEEALLHAIEAGAHGYFSGAGGVSGLAEAIRAIARGESVVPPMMLGPLLRRLIQRQREATQAAERLVILTPREREVLSLLVDGLDQSGIATVLVISPQTVRTHVQRLLRKLEVHSRSEAIALVARTGLADRLERIVDRSAS